MVTFSNPIWLPPQGDDEPKQSIQSRAKKQNERLYRNMPKVVNSEKLVNVPKQSLNTTNNDTLK